MTYNTTAIDQFAMKLVEGSKFLSGYLLLNFIQKNNFRVSNSLNPHQVADCLVGTDVDRPRLFAENYWVTEAKMANGMLNS